MSAMYRQVFKDSYYEVETTHGTEYVPVSVSGPVGHTSKLEMYLSGEPLNPGRISARRGWVGRLSMTGYLDCTRWIGAPTKSTVNEFLSIYDDM